MQHAFEPRVPHTSERRRRRRRELFLALSTRTRGGAVAGAGSSAAVRGDDWRIVFAGSAACNQQTTVSGYVEAAPSSGHVVLCGAVGACRVLTSFQVQIISNVFKPI